MGPLWLACLPGRLAFVVFAARVVQLGPEARYHGNELSRLAYLAVAAWLPSVWGRLVFVGAVRHALVSAQPPPRSLLLLPWRELLAGAGAAIVLEAAFWTLLPTVVVPILLVVVAGLAAAAAPKAPRGSAREILAGAGSLAVLLRLSLIFLAAAMLVLVNLHLFAQAALWASAGFGRVDAIAWGRALSLANPLYDLLLMTAAALLVEPFWLAALTAHVERTRAGSSGEDLLRWFEELRRA